MSELVFIFKFNRSYNAKELTFSVVGNTNKLSVYAGF